MGKFQGDLETFPPVDMRTLKDQVRNISYCFLHFETRLLKGISVLSMVLYIFIVSSKHYRFLPVFFFFFVYNKSYSREKEVARTTPNSMNKLYPMYDMMYEENNTTVVVFTKKMIYHHVEKKYFPIVVNFQINLKSHE